MSDANRVSVAYIQEGTWGTTPATPAFKGTRLTGESLAQVADTIRSQELRSDRQTPDLLRNGLRARGDINCEISYATFLDDWFAAGLQHDSATLVWNVADTVTATTISFTTTETISDSANGLAVFTVGRWIRITGAAAANNNGMFKVLTSAAGTLTVDPPVITTAAAGPSITIKEGEDVLNGTTFASFSIERKYEDLTTNEYARFVGMSIDTLELTAQPDQIVTARFGFLGKSETTANDVIAGSTYGAASANDILSGIDGVNLIMEGGEPVNAISFSMTVSNNLRERLQIGTLGPISIGSGSIAVEGTFRAYYNNADAIADKFLNFTSSGLAISFKDSTGKGYVIDLPKVKYSSATRVAEGINTDVVRDMNFTAIRESAGSVNKTIRIAKWAT